MLIRHMANSIILAATVMAALLTAAPVAGPEVYHDMKIDTANQATTDVRPAVYHDM